MPNWTPGPWCWLTTEDGEQTLYGDDSGIDPVLHIGWKWQGPTQADLRLIAAAPDLHEALEWALRYGSFEVAEDNPLHAAALDAAHAALAKARGETDA